MRISTFAEASADKSDLGFRNNGGCGVKAPHPSLQILPCVRVLFSVLFSCLVILLAGSCAYASPDTPQRPIIVVIADYLTLEDLRAPGLPNINRILSDGSVGLISPSAYRKKSPVSVYATLGAGAHIRGAAEEGYNITEPVKYELDNAGKIFARRTGMNPPERGVVNLSIGALIKANESSKRISHIGGLARAFRASRKKIAVYGNSDLDISLNRSVVLFSADETGLTPMGDVSRNMLRQEPLSPTGWITDTDKVSTAVEKASDQASLIVVDFGDTSRLYLSKDNLSQAAYDRYSQEALERLDDMIGRITDIADQKDTVMVLASFVPPEENGKQWSRLTPLVIYGKGKGMLTSGTTRREGIIAGVDIAPTLLVETGIAIPETMIGRPIVSKNSANTLTYLSRLDESSSSNIQMQLPVLGSFTAVGILAVTVSTAVLAFRRRLHPLTSGTLRLGLVLGCSLLGGLLLSGIGGPLAWRQVVWAVGGTAAFLTAGYVLSAVMGKSLRKDSLARTSLPLVCVLLLICAVIVIDLITGARLLGSSIASYQFPAGFRFYGLGNEYMGVFLGALFTAVAWLSINGDFQELKPIRRAVILIVFASAVFVTGWPGLGANAGGAIAGVVMFGLAYRAMTKGVFRPAEAVLLVLLSFLLLFAFAFIDASLGRDVSSHMGLAAGGAAKGGWINVLLTSYRKTAMNIGLMITKQSRTAILSFIPFFIMWFFGVRPVVGNLVSRYPRLKPVISAGIAGAAAAFLFNDSGIVAGALVLTSLVCTLLYSLLQEEELYVAHNGS